MSTVHCKTCHLPDFECDCPPTPRDAGATSDEIKRLEELCEKAKPDLYDHAEAIKALPALLTLARSLQAQLDAAQKAFEDIRKLTYWNGERDDVSRRNWAGIQAIAAEQVRALLAHSKLKGE